MTQMLAVKKQLTVTFKPVILYLDSNLLTVQLAVQQSHYGGIYHA